MLQPTEKIFLQACANRGALEIEEAKEIFSKISETHSSEESEESNLDIVIEKINKAIHKLDQEIVTFKHEVLQKTFIVFSATAESEINKHQSNYTTIDRSYFQCLLKAIITTDDYCLSKIIAANLTSELGKKPITKEHAYSLINEWVEIGYFVELDEIKLSLGPRMMVEFANYIKTNFPEDTKECILCKRLVFWSVSCTDCNSTFHNDCIIKHLNRVSKCPSCKKAWSVEIKTE